MPRSLAVVLAALCAAFGLSVLVLVLDRATDGSPADRVQARLDARQGAAGSESGRSGGEAPDPALASRRRIGGSLGLLDAAYEETGRGTSRGATPPGVPAREPGTRGSGLAGGGSGTLPGGDASAAAYDGRRSAEEAVPADVALLEESTAALARSLGLADPSVVAWRAERLVPEGSVPPGMLPEAREVAERYGWANEAIAKARAEAYANPEDRAVARGLALTLGSGADPERREEQLRESLDQLSNP